MIKHFILSLIISSCPTRETRDNKRIISLLSFISELQNHNIHNQKFMDNHFVIDQVSSIDVFWLLLKLNDFFAHVCRVCSYDLENYCR